MWVLVRIRKSHARQVRAFLERVVGPVGLQVGLLNEILGVGAIVRQPDGGSEQRSDERLGVFGEVCLVGHTTQDRTVAGTVQDPSRCEPIRSRSVQLGSCHGAPERVASAMLSVIWHYWIGVLLAVGSIAAILGLVLGYIVKVKRIQYPREN